MIAVTRGIWALLDLYALEPAALEHTYQATCPCYNLVTFTNRKIVSCLNEGTLHVHMIMVCVIHVL